MPVFCRLNGIQGARRAPWCACSAFPSRARVVVKMYIYRHNTSEFLALRRESLIVAFAPIGLHPLGLPQSGRNHARTRSNENTPGRERRRVTESHGRGRALSRASAFSFQLSLLSCCVSFVRPEMQPFFENIHETSVKGMLHNVRQISVCS